MARRLEWNIDVEGENHKVALDYCMFMGKAIVEIDGDKFDISTGLFKLRGTSQMFKLGEKPAMLDFPKKGKPGIIFDGVRLSSEKIIIK